MTPEYRKLAKNGLWHNNPALVQVLGLCPLLAVSSNFINALGLSLATLFVLTLSNSLVSLSRRHILAAIRIPVFVLLIACAVTIAELLIRAFAYPLYQALGIYLALIVTNCVIIARAESLAVKSPLPQAAADGFFMGLGFALVLLLLGAMREILATGKLFAGAERLFGAAARNWEITLINLDHGMILAALPAGAFICYGLLIAAKNAVDLRLQARTQTPSVQELPAPQA